MGFFYIASTLWFRILLAALAFAILVSLGRQIDLLLGPFPVRQPDSFYGAPDVTVIFGKSLATQMVEDIRETMRTLLGHVQQESDGEKVFLYGSHSMWAAASPIVLYLGLLLVTFGLAMNGYSGWQQSDVRLLPGKPISVGPEAAHRIQLLSTESTSGAVTLEIGEEQQIVIKRNGGTHRQGFVYRLTDSGGPLIQVSAQRDGDEPLMLYNYATRPEPTESLQFAFSPTVSEEADRLFIVPDEKLVGRLKWLSENRSDENPRFHLWIFRQDGKELVGDARLVAEGNSAVAAIDDITYILRVSRYAILSVRYQPGLNTLVTGGVLVITGLLGSAIPRQRMWSAVVPQADRVTIRTQVETKGLSGRFQRRRDAALADLRARIEEV